jgi:hypothetical protein
MNESAKKYLVHIEQLMKTGEVADFAKEVYDKTIALLDGKITQKEFNDGIYLPIDETLYNDNVQQARRSINYIKERIATWNS